MVGGSIKRVLLNIGYGSKESCKDLLCPSRSELDLSSYLDLDSWFKKYKAFYCNNLCSKSWRNIYNSTQPYDFIIDNLKIQTNLIELSHLHGVKKAYFFRK